MVDVDSLRRQLQGPEPDRPVLLDVRYRLGGPPGRIPFEQGHLPGAAFVDLDTALATIRPGGVGGRHPMPEVEAFESAMRDAGVRDGRPVVAYDDWSSLAASRAWWLLRYFGKDDVTVLDGGLRAWTSAGGPLETGWPRPAPGDLTARPGHARLLDADAVGTYADRGLLLDARPAGRYRGEDETVDPVAGHIPGARSAPALANVDDEGRFLPREDLAARFAEQGLHPGSEPATYCGSGVQAAHLALALAHAGVNEDAGVYVGSWSDWITDPARPVETG